jgi:lipoate-protein ligase B
MTVSAKNERQRDAQPADHRSQTEFLYCLDLGLFDYGQALDLQHRLVEARKSSVLDHDLLLMLQHPAVFTLGRRGGIENLRVPRETLESAGIEIIQVERGGNITFHGPGQLVAYLIFDLQTSHTGVDTFVSRLEEIMIRSVRDWGIRAARSPVNHGIWVGRRKIGSVGIAIRKGITYHGLALNVNLSLEPFTWINPCGLDGVQMTSMQAETSRSVNLPDVSLVLKRHFQDVFRIPLMPIEMEALPALSGTA